MAAPFLGLALAATSVAWGHAPITKVVVEAPGATNVAELRRTFGVIEGGTLSRSDIRGGVEALMATGAVDDAAVEVEEGEGGTVVRLRVEVASRVRALRVTGFPRWAGKRIRTALGLIVGAPLRVMSFQANLERARQDLVGEGYPRLRLDPNLAFDVPRDEVTVTIDGSLGAPVTLRELAAPGSSLAGRELWKVCGLSPGQRLSGGRLEQARRRLAENLRRKGFWETEVDTSVVSEGADGATVRFAVIRGPAYTLALEGLKNTKALAEDALPFLRGDEPFAEAALDVAMGKVRMFLQQQGRLLAQATGEVTGPANNRTLHLTVKRGPLTPIVAVRFPGARSVPLKELRERVGARAGHFWRWGGEPVDDDTLAADASSLLGTLRTAGFADARVGDPRIVPEGAGVVIEFSIEEGMRRVVERLTLEGMPDGFRLPKLSLAQGLPWSQGAEDQARNAVEAALQEAGFPDARVVSSHTCDGESCTVTVRAEPGSPAVTGRVVIAGLARTRRQVVEQVAGLKQGDVAGPEARVAAQRRLLALGIFQRASVRAIPGQDTGSRRGLLLDVEEGPSQAYSFGLGYDTEQKARVSVSWSEINLFGTAHSLSVQGLFSSQQQRFQVDYREPARLGVLGFPTWVSFYRTQEHFTTYDLLDRGTWVEFGDRLRRPFHALLRYEYQIVEPTAPAEILSQLEREQQHLAISSVTPTVEWDTRDDLFSPRRGLYASLQFQSAFKAFSADAVFDKLTASLSAFTPAQGGVLAVTVRGGAIEPHNSAPGTPDNLLLPIAVRFFGGGRVSNRAFSTDELGIPGQTLECQQPTSGTTSSGCTVVPTGGAGMLLASVEWRFPVFGPVGGNVFLDGGNVWQAWRDVRVGEMRWGAGLGVRVETPVGPLRLEYGWKFRRLEIGTPPNSVVESPGELVLSFGNPF